ncbi:sugar phosphate isomerase/epimerase family protein [Brucella anthropi]|uniref:sugar phosphate isomerase/epimerase family protein n=1 Tax=Brucella anthropi TaxID=529 RepID=UPI00124E583E|nr:sugar phosphate isomerase/epimerase family protein [Brucella anthropi]KAB2777281.1 sugar phosphate isomerase/epimerase [Brucella anthropi]
MKLAVSNIAWPASERDAAYALLSSRGILGLEIAPALFLPDSADPFEPSEKEVGQAHDALHAAGLKLVSMQSLLYGVKGASLFEGGEALRLFREGLHRAIVLAGRLSIPNLVFGSPRQRIIPNHMSATEAEAIAIDVFRDLGDAASLANTCVGIEFNPLAYGTNFLNDLPQACAFIEKVNHPSVALTFDIGAMHMNRQFGEIDYFAHQAGKYIHHVHISEPHLAPAPAEANQAAKVLSVLKKIGYQGWFSIEMQAIPGGSLSKLERSLDKLVLAASMVDGVGQCG